RRRRGDDPAGGGRRLSLRAGLCRDVSPPGETRKAGESRPGAGRPVRSARRAKTQTDGGYLGRSSTFARVERANPDIRMAAAEAVRALAVHDPACTPTP